MTSFVEDRMAVRLKDGGNYEAKYEFVRSGNRMVAYGPTPESARGNLLAMCGGQLNIERVWSSDGGVQFVATGFGTRDAVAALHQLMLRHGGCGGHHIIGDTT